MDQAWGLCWSPDGQNLGLVGWKAAGDPRNQILIVSAVGGKVTGIADDNSGGTPALYTGISWSPDGKWISYDSWESEKTRPGAAIWEVELGGFLERMARRTLKSASAGDE